MIAKTIILDSCDSTNDYIRQLGMQPDFNPPVCVIAKQQLKGRGRMGRSWASPAGGIYLSLGMRIHTPTNQISCMTLVCALAVCKAIAAITKVAPSIKWPNDILAIGFDGKPIGKLCGILTETISQSDCCLAIVGVGINIFRSQDYQPPLSTGCLPALPPAFLGEIANSQTASNYQQLQPLQVGLAVAQNIEVYMQKWQDGGYGFARFREEYLRHLCWLNEWVSVRSNITGAFASDGSGVAAAEFLPVRGRLVGIGDGGEALLLTADGMTLPFSSGELSLRACE